MMENIPPEQVEQDSNDFLEILAALKEKRNKKIMENIPPDSSIRCSCGLLKWRDVEAITCEFFVNKTWENIRGENVSYKYCPECGDKLNLDGTTENRKELEMDSILFNLLLFHDIVCGDELCGYCAKNETCLGEDHCYGFSDFQPIEKERTCETCAYRPTNYGDSEICVTRCEKYSEWSQR